MESIPDHHLLEFKPDTLDAIKRKYKMDLNTLIQSIDILEAWLKKQYHFVKREYDRDILEKLLIANKGSVERTKIQLDKLCTLKTLLPKFFVDCNMKTDMTHMHKMGWILPTPKMTRDHYRILIAKVLTTSAGYKSSYTLDFYRLILIVCEYLRVHDYTDGYIIIEDFRDVNLTELLAKVNVVELQQFTTILMEGYRAKIKGIHILADSKIVELFVNTIKTMVNVKILNRIFIHRTLDELYTAVDKDLLPLEYGGKEKSIDSQIVDWLDALSSEDHIKHLREMRAARTNEDLRRTDKFNEMHMGLPGSFKTLTVD